MLTMSSSDFPFTSIDSEAVESVDLDALLENELDLIDENEDKEPDTESEFISSTSNTGHVPHFEEFDNVMSELLASSQSIFVGQEISTIDERESVSTQPVVVSTTPPLIDHGLHVFLEDNSQSDVSELSVEDRNIIIALLDLMVESVECSGPVLLVTDDSLPPVQSVVCDLQLFDESQVHQLATDTSADLSSLLHTATIVPSESELAQLLQANEGLILNEERKGQLEINKLNEELVRETEKMNERNKKRERQRQLAHRNAKATRLQSWYRKLLVIRKVKKLRESTARRRAVEAIRQQKALEEAETQRVKAVEENAARLAREQRELERSEQLLFAREEEWGVLLRRQATLETEMKQQQQQLRRQRELEEAAEALRQQTYAEEQLRAKQATDAEDNKRRLEAAAEAMKSFEREKAQLTAKVEQHKHKQQEVTFYEQLSTSNNNNNNNNSNNVLKIEVNDTKDHYDCNEEDEVLCDAADDDDVVYSPNWYEDSVELSPDPRNNYNNKINKYNNSSSCSGNSSGSLGRPVTAFIATPIDDSVVNLSDVRFPPRTIESFAYTYIDGLVYPQEEIVFASLPAEVITLLPTSQLTQDTLTIAESNVLSLNATHDVLRALFYWQQKENSKTPTRQSVIRGALSVDITPSVPVKMKKQQQGKQRGVYYDATDYTRSVENINSFEDIVQTYPNLMKLNLKVNLLKDLTGLDALFRLQELNLNDNKIENVEVLGRLQHLQTLQLDSNSVKNAERLNGLVSLTTLSLAMNKLTVMPVLRLPSLKRLELHHNDLRELPSHCLDYLPSLTLLDLGSNKLTTVNGEVLSACCLLQSLILSHNSLLTVPTPLYLPVLKSLWLSGNQLNSLHGWVPTVMQYKDGSPSVEKWPLFTPMLQRLVLKDNRISFIDAHVLSVLPQLSDLDLSFNAIESRLSVLALRESQSLQVLQIQDNRILNTQQSNNTTTTATEAGQFQTKSDLQQWMLQLCPHLKRFCDDVVVVVTSSQSERSNETDEGECSVQALFKQHFLQLLIDAQAAINCTNALLKLSTEDKPLASPNADVTLLCEQYVTLLTTNSTSLSHKGAAAGGGVWLNLCRPLPLQLNHLIAFQSAFRGYRVRRRLQAALGALRQQQFDADLDDDWGVNDDADALIQDMCNIDETQLFSDYNNMMSEGASMVYGDHIKRRKSKRSFDEEHDEVYTSSAATQEVLVAPRMGGVNLNNNRRSSSSSAAVSVVSETSRPASASSEVSNHSLPLGGMSQLTNGGAQRLHHYSNMSPLSSARSDLTSNSNNNNNYINNNNNNGSSSNNGLINPRNLATEWGNDDPGVLATLMKTKYRVNDQHSGGTSVTSKNTGRVDLSRKNNIQMSGNTSNYVTSGSFGGKVIHVRRGGGGGGAKGKKANRPAWSKVEDESAGYAEDEGDN